MTYHQQTLRQQVDLNSKKRITPEWVKYALATGSRRLLFNNEDVMYEIKRVTLIQCRLEKPRRLPAAGVRNTPIFARLMALSLIRPTLF